VDRACQRRNVYRKGSDATSSQPTTAISPSGRDPGGGSRTISTSHGAMGSRGTVALGTLSSTMTTPHASYCVTGEGVPLHAVSKLLGHATVAVTARTYDHTTALNFTRYIGGNGLGTVPCFTGHALNRTAWRPFKRHRARPSRAGADEIGTTVAGCPTNYRSTSSGFLIPMSRRATPGALSRRR
jgi:hypothetical protein